MRLIDANAFAEFLKDAIKRQKYEDSKIDGLLTVADVIEAVISELDGTSLAGLKNAPTIEPEIVRCKDCRKHNVSSGYKNDCCALYEWRGISYGHEHDYQYCCFAERRTDEGD